MFFRYHNSFFDDLLELRTLLAYLMVAFVRDFTLITPAEVVNGTPL